MDDKKNQKNGKSNLPNYMLFFFIGQLFFLLMLFCFGWKITKPTNVENDVAITENIDIQRSIKKANGESQYYLNPSNYYKYIYINNTLDSFTFYSALDYFMQVNINNSIPYGDSVYLYPLYAHTYSDDRDSIYAWGIAYSPDPRIIELMYVDVSNMEVLGVYMQFWWNSVDGVSSTPIPSFVINNVMLLDAPLPLTTLSLFGFDFPVGINNYNLYNLFSSQPFVDVCPEPAPTYEMAPSSLINNIPLDVQYPSSNNNNKNVSPTLSYPSVDGKYYSSIFGSALSVFGSQGQNYYDYKADIYLKSSLRPKQQVYGFDDFISYYDTYDYLFTGFDIVVQTMWGQLPIYYKITTNDFGFAYDVSRLLNESNTIDDYFNLSITSDIETRYSDYVHINIQFYFNADTDYDSKYFNVNEEYEFEALIPNTLYNGEYIQAEFGSVRYDADSFITNDEVVANGAYETLKNYRVASSNVINRLEQAYSDEYEQGYNEGYSAGVVDAGGENALGPVFAWLVSASSIIANVLSIQIFPYITLGMLLLFPLVVFVIVWILKLFFGG